MENKKKRDYRNHSKITKNKVNNKVNKTPIEKTQLRYKIEETEDVNIEPVNTSKILDRIEKEKSQFGFSLERLDNIENSKVIGDLDINLSSRRVFSEDNFTYKSNETLEKKKMKK